jgi:hypothetical protein
LAEKEDWQLAEHFKLHLHPSYVRAAQDIIVQPLPTGVSIEQIYADFFGYLRNHTKEFFEAREINGKDIWERLEKSGGIEWVFPAPNGWGPWEHAILRKTAVLGGLVPEGKSNDLIHMVSEAEASVHYVMTCTDLDKRLKPGVEFIVCDAGGSTVDTTLYVAKSVNPVLKLKERAPSGCIQAGGIFVNQAVEKYFSNTLSSAKIEGQVLKDRVREAVESFESGPKKTFAGPEGELDEFFVYVGGHKFSEESLGIRRGRKAFTRTEMEPFFMPLADQILEAVEEQMQGHSVKHIILVGGFGDSPYLRSRFQSNSRFKGAEVILANNSTAKAVAEGAVIWNIQHSVTARAVRFAYGLENFPLYNSKDPSQVGRQRLSTVNRGWIVDHVWLSLVKKGKILKADQCSRMKYGRHFKTSNPDVSDIKVKIYVSQNDEPTRLKTYFMTDRSGNWVPGVSLACTIHTDMTSGLGTLKRHRGADGTYWTLDYEVVVFFGRTELMAQAIWKDAKGKEHRSAAVVVPEKF